MAKTPKKKDGRGRPPSVDTVRVMSLKRNGVSLKTLKLTFSENVILKLLELHDDRYSPFYYTPRQERLKILRVQFGRLSDINIPGIFVHVEPPSYDPKGSRVTQLPGKRAYQCRILCRKLGLKDDIPAMSLEVMWMEPQRGLLVLFPDEYKLPPRAEVEREANPDLTVR